MNCPMNTSSVCPLHWEVPNKKIHDPYRRIFLLISICCRGHFKRGAKPDKKRSRRLSCVSTPGKTGKFKANELMGRFQRDGQFRQTGVANDLGRGQRQGNKILISCSDGVGFEVRVVATRLYHAIYWWQNAASV